MEGGLADAKIPRDLGDLTAGGQLCLRLAHHADDLLWGYVGFSSSRVLLMVHRGGRTLIVTGSVFGEQVTPGAVYTETILAPGHEFMLEHYFHPLVETNKAWTVILVETGIVNREVGSALLGAILALEAEGPDAIREFDPDDEYLYSHMEHYLIDKVGEEIAGEINIGRTRSEPLTRMVVRERLLNILDESTAASKNLDLHEIMQA